MKDSHGQTDYDWDRLHRPKQVTEPDSKTISYQYDWNNNRTKMTDHFAGETFYEYNDRGLLDTLTDRNDGETVYSYYDDGALHTMTYPNGVVATYTYNERGWLETLNHMSGSTLIAGFTYEYDPTDWGKNGTRTAMEESILLPDGINRIQARVDYAYDGLYRLTREYRQGDYDYDKSYAYDRNGNRGTMVDASGTTYYHYDYASKLLDYGTSNTPGSPSNTNLTYDGAGNTETITPPGQNPIVTTHTWDWNNMLTKVEEGTTTLAQFAYDGEGARISATFDTGPVGFLYDNDNVIEELGSQENLLAFYTIGSDGIMSRILPSSAPMYCHGDGLASIKAMTNGTPVVVTSAYSYDAWGNHLVAAGSAEYPCQYVGRFGYYTHSQETDLNLLQLGARYYHPEVGRFMSADPVGYSAGLNQYAYVGNNPVCFSDSSGLDRNQDEDGGTTICVPAGPCKVERWDTGRSGEGRYPGWPPWKLLELKAPFLGPGPNIPVTTCHWEAWIGYGKQHAHCVRYPPSCLALPVYFEKRIPCTIRHRLKSCTTEDWPGEDWWRKTFDRVPWLGGNSAF